MGKDVMVEIKYENVFLCTSPDTVLYIKKTYKIDSRITDFFLKIKVIPSRRQFENAYKILYIEQTSQPIDKDGDKFPDNCDQCPDEPGLVDFQGCPDSDKDGTADKDDECPGVVGTVRCKGCPDKDGDGVKDALDKCPDVRGEEIYSGCPEPVANNNTTTNPPVHSQPTRPKPAVTIDSDGDGVSDKLDDCPYEFARTSNGCPPKPKIKRYRDYKLLGLGLSLSGGISFGHLKGHDPDIIDSSGLGFSPALFTTIRFSENVYLQVDLCYFKSGFKFYNYGNNFEYGYNEPLAYYTEDAKMNFQEVKSYLKVNVYSFFIGCYYGRVLSAKRKGNIDCTDPSGASVQYNRNYEYDFLNDPAFPVVNNSYPINRDIFGITIGYEKILDNNLLLGLGYDFSLNSYFNNKYPLWEDYYNVDFYDSKQIEIRMSYLYAKIGYQF
ncbi:MAG: hypothetical protein IPH12_14145 [Saprospirales bacterium]|nr:hypothetical protein [Saprospirales bacterium]